MRIGINLLFLLPGVVGGTETYATSLLRALAQLDQNNKYLLFLNKECSDLKLPNQPNFNRIICPIHARYRTARYFWEQIVLPFQCQHYNLDLLHSLGYVQPLQAPCPTAVTIHDLNFHNLGPYLSPLRRHVLKFFVSRSAKNADHVFTVSEFSKQQIINVLEVDSAKITGTYNAGKKLNGKGIPPLPVLSEKFGIYQPYILGLSSTSPHKNMQALVKAFSRVKEQYASKLMLVLAGRFPSDQGKLMRLIIKNELEESVRFTGYVSDQVLASLYKHASIFVFPSLYEGFGIPVLEALTYETPVACSNRASLPEVGGDAVLFFDPEDINEMSETIITLLKDKSLQRKLISKGKEHLKNFTWERTAKKTLEIYRQIGR